MPTLPEWVAVRYEAYWIPKSFSMSRASSLNPLGILEALKNGLGLSELTSRILDDSVSTSEAVSFDSFASVESVAFGFRSNACSV